MKKLQIFGIKLNKITKKEIFQKIDEYLKGDDQHYFLTTNPEMLLAAGKDEEFFYIINRADLSIPDGIGLKFAAWAMFDNVNIIPGADLVKDILKMAETRGVKIGIINWAKGLSDKKYITEALGKMYPKLKFLIEDVGTRNCAFPQEGCASLRDFQPDILFVTLGAVNQEKFIYHNLDKFPSVKLAMGVGASFDYLTGKTRRAPLVMRRLGFEWLWRLLLILGKKNTDGSVHKIKRSKRIYNAVVKFPLRFIRWRFVLPFQYRPNVACLMYKREGEKIKIFIVKRSTEENHWQLPQGGIDKGEDAMTAGARELREETGVSDLKVIKTFNNIWKYSFPKDKNALNRASGYRGQRQSLFIAEFLGKDEDIKINFWDHDDLMWIEADKLADKVFYMRKESTELYLTKLEKTLKLKKK